MGYNHADFRQFLKVFAACFFGGLACVVLCIFIVAPYEPVGESQQQLFFNDYRPAAPLYTRQGKIVHITALKPQALILGTSRAEIALDPDHAIFTSRPAFNLAMPKLRIGDMRRLLEHAHANGPVKEAVLSLDFLMFNALFDQQDSLFKNLDSPDLTGINTTMIGRKADYAIRKNLSFAALKDVGRTIKASLANTLPPEFDRSPHRADGQRWSIRSVKTKTAQRAIFWAYEVYYLFGDMWRPKNTKAFVFNHTTQSGKTYDTLDELRKLFAFAYKNNIKIYPVILPAHARLWETMRIAGLWPMFELWKAQMVLINTEEAIKAGVPPVTIWDFSGYNKISTEPVPPLDDTQTQMQYFHDGSHAKNKVGNMVLDCMAGQCPQNFGYRLKHNNVMQVLTDINKKREKWLDANIKESLQIMMLAEDKRNAELVYDPFLDMNQTE